MIKYYTTDIVFSEIPDEVSLAISITNCPNRCTDCHSSWLWEDTGIELDDSELTKLLTKYSDITCVLFMGGDNDPSRINQLATNIKSNHDYKIAWYSGKSEIDKNINIDVFDYIKIGPYDKIKGPLNSKTTNQRLYRINHPSNELVDITDKFWKS